MGISQRRRFRILKRDSFRCRYCGAAASDGVELHVDHVHPRALGGSDDCRNLVTACAECNRGKGVEPPPWTECTSHWDWTKSVLLWRPPSESELVSDGLSPSDPLRVKGSSSKPTSLRRILEIWGEHGLGGASCL